MGLDPAEDVVTASRRGMVVVAAIANRSITSVRAKRTFVSRAGDLYAHSVVPL